MSSGLWTEGVIQVINERGLPLEEILGGLIVSQFSIIFDWGS